MLIIYVCYTYRYKNFLLWLYYLNLKLNNTNTIFCQWLDPCLCRKVKSIIVIEAKSILSTSTTIKLSPCQILFKSGKQFSC